MALNPKSYQHFNSDDDFYVQCISNDPLSERMDDEDSIRTYWRNRLPLPLDFNKSAWEVGVAQVMMRNRLKSEVTLAIQEVEDDNTHFKQIGLGIHDATSTFVQVVDEIANENVLASPDFTNQRIYFYFVWHPRVPGCMFYREGNFNEWYGPGNNTVEHFLMYFQTNSRTLLGTRMPLMDRDQVISNPNLRDTILSQIDSQYTPNNTVQFDWTVSLTDNGTYLNVYKNGAHYYWDVRLGIIMPKYLATVLQLETPQKFESNWESFSQAYGGSSQNLQFWEQVRDGVTYTHFNIGLDIKSTWKIHNASTVIGKVATPLLKQVYWENPNLVVEFSDKVNLYIVFKEDFNSADDSDNSAQTVVLLEKKYDLPLSEYPNTLKEAGIVLQESQFQILNCELAGLKMAPREIMSGMQNDKQEMIISGIPIEPGKVLVNYEPLRQNIIYRKVVPQQCTDIVVSLKNIDGFRPAFYVGFSSVLLHFRKVQRWLHSTQ